MDPSNLAKVEHPAIDVSADRRLTRRQAEIVTCVAHGASNREVAATLGLSEQTVRNQLCAIYAKLGFSGRTRLVLFATGRHDAATASPAVKVAAGEAHLAWRRGGGH